MRLVDAKNAILSFEKIYIGMKLVIFYSYVILLGILYYNN